MGKIIKNKISYAGGGAEGKSAYQTWLDLGNTGTEQDFLDSLGGSASINDNDISLDSTWSSEKILIETAENYAIFEGVIGDSYYSTIIDEEDITNVPSSLYGGWTLDTVTSNGDVESILSNYNNTTTKRVISLSDILSVNDISDTSISLEDTTKNSGGQPYKFILVWENNSKELDGKIYTSLEELGLTAPTTVGEVFMAMPEKSMLMLNVEALVDDGTNVLTVTDVPKEFGVLTIEKHIYGRFRIEYSNSLGGAVFNARKWIGALKGSDGTGLVWKEVNTGNHKYTTMAELALDGSTATIQDVIDKVAIGDSVMMRTDAFNNNNWQTQCNGIQWGYLKIEKTQNGLSNIELQEVITPNRRYFGAQSSGKFAGWVATTGTKGLVTNAQNFKLDITKNHASWYGFFKLEYLYGTELCQVDVGIANTIDYRVTKGRNHIDKITHTVNGANIVLGIDFISKVYGVQVVEMPSEFGTINNLTAEQFTGDTAATYVDSSNEIIHTNLSGNLAGITTVLDLVNALLTEYRATSPKKPIRFVSGEFTKTTLTDLPVAYGLLQITVAGWDVIEVRLAHSANGFKTMYYGFVNRISGEESISSITWRMVETKSIYNSVAELNKAKGTSIELINGEDNTQKIVDALSVGEQFISLYHNNANQNRFGIDVSYGNLINEIRITKCLDADLTANYATVTAFMNTGVTMSRIYYKTYSTDWCVNGTIKYSTGEVAIGTWIDGSTIYRTVVEFNSVEAKTSESEVQVATNIPVATPQKVIRMEGFVNLIGNQFYIHYPNITCNDDTIKATVNIANGNVKLKGTWKYPIGKGALILEYIK